MPWWAVIPSMLGLVVMALVFYAAWLDVGDH